MIKETFIALKAIGVSDEHILDVVAAFEARHDEYRNSMNSIRDDMHEMKRDIAVMKRAIPVMFGLMVTILFKVFSK